MFHFGSLFSGIGGLDLGLERAGFSCSWQVEIDPYARQVLAKHWPQVSRASDVRAFHPTESVDVIAGGFPCQDVSVAGRGAGLAGRRSGLWSEFRRIVEEVTPRVVLIENVPALRKRGLATVLSDLHALGYDALWDGLPAEAFGAHHVRDRLFVVAWHASDPIGDALRFGAERQQWEGWRVRAAIGRDAESLEHGPIDGWSARPPLARMDHGLPGEMERSRGLGNAVVPQVAEYVGRMIHAAMELR